jgi:isoquinoline 1-oxidoreductase subunit beta
MGKQIPDEIDIAGPDRPERPERPERRRFLGTVAATGAFMLAMRWDDAVPAASPFNAGNAQDPAFAPDAFIRIDRAGIVTLIVPRVEMGQGTYTALPVMVAEELEVDPRSMRLEHAPASDKLYANPMSGFQNTGGSTSIRSAWVPMRRAGAAARLMLVAAAAQRWQVDPATCRAEQGQVLHPPSKRRIAYGDLVEDAAKQPLPAEPALKPPAEFARIGKALDRLDGPEKVNGQARFGLDALPEGLQFAAIQHCPVIGGRVAHVDATSAHAVRGVRQVVVLEDVVAVVADHYGAARKGLAALKVTWDEGANRAYTTEALVADLAQASTRSGAVARQQADALAAAATPGTKTLEAVYQQPLLAHACMEPVNCTVHVRPDGCDLWLGTQVPTRAQAAAAAVTGLPIERIDVHNHLLGGGFGRRLDVDFVTQAVKIARHVKRPVKVIWSREEDTRTSTFRPYHYNRLAATLDAEGRPVAWRHRVTGSSILARWAPARFQNGVDGDAIRDAAGPYGFEHLLIEYVRQEPAAGITTGFWRGVGHMQNAFPVECFMDELAESAGRDPIDYRRALLAAHPRALRVLDILEQRSGWRKPLASGRGRGVALTFCFGSYAAQVTEISVSAEGDVKVERVTIVADCGRLITPDVVVAQMQGGTVFGLTAALFGNITIKEGRVEQGNFDTYRLLRYNEMPAIDVHLLDSTEEPGGVGEVGTVLVAPSLVNAVHAATGKRLRRLPLSAEDLKRS